MGAYHIPVKLIWSRSRDPVYFLMEYLFKLAGVCVFLFPGTIALSQSIEAVPERALLQHQRVSINGNTYRK